ncbi:MAG: (2Fe-2S) ferredoxin domain-containing protein [Defluviitaleaceae bacterium]|nr:(2Fe-2S) ferredoxin domain-containing protein [Defluviitaleaceae bacterium]
MAKKVNSWDDLKALRQDALNALAGKPEEWVVVVGMATCCSAAGADQVLKTIDENVKQEGLSNVKIIQTGCYGNCYAEPVVEVRRGDQAMGEGVRYGYVDVARAKEIVTRHLKYGEVLKEAVVGQDQEVYIP